jgi:hypothetical protein
MEKTQPISLRVRDGVKRDLQALAYAEGLTLAQYLERLILTHIADLKRSRAAAQQPEPRRTSRAPSENESLDGP